MSTTLPSSTCSLAPTGKFNPSGSCTATTGVWVSLGTRTLTSTSNCPVLVNTALCSIAHSSGASRLALLQRAAQPGGGGVFAGADSACGAAVGAGCGAALDLGACWAWPGETKAARITTARNVEIFTEPAPG